MVRDLLADGAEQQAPEASTPARADDEELGTHRLVDEHLGRLPFRGSRFAVDARLQSPRFGECVGRGVLCALLEACARVDRRRPEARVDGRGDVPCTDDAQHGIAQRRLAGGEAQRRLAAFGPVHTDDHHVRHASSAFWLVRDREPFRTGQEPDSSGARYSSFSFQMWTRIRASSP